MKHSESGRSDIVFSLILLVSSAVLLFYGSAGLSSLLDENAIITSFQRGKTKFLLHADDKHIGEIAISIEDASDIRVEGNGYLLTVGSLVNLHFKLSANLLGQVKKGIIQLSDGNEQIVVSINGIHPLHWSTRIGTQGDEKHANSTADELLELTFEENTLHVPKKMFTKHLLEIINRLKIDIREYDSVDLQHSDLTLKELKKAFLEAHIESST